ncbi:hypothetical protein MRB53_009226 [Persea americana]|uniref:Uncharacterized protein n=1 Tax=Persea americana TaxID=3435 RepID=A0ACC2LNF4_PERAE|nr:hypothetical protein MRB53_009226 [Persea americana]
MFVEAHMLQQSFALVGSNETDSPIEEVSSNENADASTLPNPLRDGASPEAAVLWKEELECLVRGGVSMDLRGQV